MTPEEVYKEMVHSQFRMAQIHCDIKECVQRIKDNCLALEGPCGAD